MSKSFCRPHLNKGLFVILSAVALDAVGIGLIAPIVPDLLRAITHHRHVETQYGLLMALYAAMQFCFSPVLGVLSDRYGRRPILLLSLAGAAIDYLVMSQTSLLWVLYCGRVISGITGANMAVATAYIADISAEEQRAKRFGYMNAAFGVGFVAGPLLGGVLGNYSVHYPFLAAAFFNGLNLLVGFFLLPESRRPGESEEKRSLNPFASLAFVRGLSSIGPLITIFFLIHFVGQVPGTLWVIYCQEKFGWTALMVGVSMASFGLLHAGAQAFLTGPLTKRIGERGTIWLGVASDSFAFLLTGLATQGWMVFVLMPFYCIGGISVPALQTLLSKKVSEAQQGELQGVLVSLMNLAAVFGPIGVTRIYGALAWPSAVWIGAAVLYLSCIPALILAQRDSKKYEPTATSQSPIPSD
jgi:DHA1 family tetracycline resistance protein-like MFS transporter